MNVNNPKIQQGHWEAFDDDKYRLLGDKMQINLRPFIQTYTGEVKLFGAKHVEKKGLDNVLKELNDE